MFHGMALKDRKALVAAARGERPLDVLIHDVTAVNVFTCELLRCDIGIFGDRIALVAEAGRYEPEARSAIDGGGRVAAPGLVDPHLHIESSMMSPAGFAAGVLRHGTTTVIADPHEIANVMGRRGVTLMIEGSEGLPLRTLFAVPSCVPALDRGETAAARFEAADIAEMLELPRIVGVAEVMDYMGVADGEARMLGIVEAGAKSGKTIQGHAPALVGRDLMAYRASGIENDHELRGGAEAVEKLRLGLLPFVKLGSHANHLPNLVPELLETPHLDVALCTDDVEPTDLLNEGHMNRVVREVVRLGADPARAVRWASLIGAQHYNLRDVGAIAPGYMADIVLFDDVDSFNADEVFAGGRRVVQNGELCVPIDDPLKGRRLDSSVKIGALSSEDFVIEAPIEKGDVGINLIAMQPNRTTLLETVSVAVKNGRVDADTLPEDLCFVAVVPRHGQTHKPSVALVRGLGLRLGAMAHTVAHDSHNILVLGKTPDAMLAAVHRLKEIGGGFVLIKGDSVAAEVPLPLAGLMSLKGVAEMADAIEAYNQVAHDMGVRPHATPPIVAATGLALPVVPEVRITDLHPLFDVASQKPMPLFP
ncbi:MAG: amidohydrolase family protein [Rhodospirillales bacterium]|nr:amidohydrolase family protein [Rhodospirillales bacterium]